MIRNCRIVLGKDYQNIYDFKMKLSGLNPQIIMILRDKIHQNCTIWLNDFDKICYLYTNFE